MKSLLPLILGLVLFLGGHVVSRLNGLRAGLIEKFGPNTYRALYSLWALMGLALIVYGFQTYRASGYIQIWNPPRFFTHLSVLLMLFSFILLAATYLPGHIKAKAKHPMLASIKIWALAHLLVNGDLGSMILSSAFLGWAVYARIALKRAGGAVPQPVLGAAAWRNDGIAVAIGLATTFAFIYGLHTALIGVDLLTAIRSKG
jgi:uncharacterized membrane protein